MYKIGPLTPCFFNEELSIMYTKKLTPLPLSNAALYGHRHGRSQLGEGWGVYLGRKGEGHSPNRLVTGVPHIRIAVDLRPHHHDAFPAHNYHWATQTVSPPRFGGHSDDFSTLSHDETLDMKPIFFIPKLADGAGPGVMAGHREIESIYMWEGREGEVKFNSERFCMLSAPRRV